MCIRDSPGTAGRNLAIVASTLATVGHTTAAHVLHLGVDLADTLCGFVGMVRLRPPFAGSGLIAGLAADVLAAATGSCLAQTPMKLLVALGSVDKLATAAVATGPGPGPGPGPGSTRLHAVAQALAEEHRAKTVLDRGWWLLASSRHFRLDCRRR